MAYVNMTKDFSKVKKTISGLGITKRQLLAFISAAAVGIPVFLLCKPYLEVTNAVIVMSLSAMPVCMALLYQKNGMYIEKHIKYWHETHFVRNTDRPYQICNLYDLILEEEKLKEEAECILFKGKSKQEIEEIKKSGKTQEIKVANKKLVVPLTGKIDRATKKELEKMVKKAKIQGTIPESAQDTIPYKVPYEDGIFESDDGYFTQTIAFEDITYELLDNDPKNMLFERWCRLINFFDPDVHFQFNYGNG